MNNDTLIEPEMFEPILDVDEALPDVGNEPCPGDEPCFGNEEESDN